MIAPAPAPTRAKRTSRIPQPTPESVSQERRNYYDIRTDEMSAAGLYVAIVTEMQPLFLFVRDEEGGEMQRMQALVPACRAVAKLIAVGQSIGILRGAVEPSVSNAHDSIMGAAALIVAPTDPDHDLAGSQEMAAYNLIVRGVREFSAVPLGVWIELDREEEAHLRSLRSREAHA